MAKYEALRGPSYEGRSALAFNRRRFARHTCLSKGRPESIRETIIESTEEKRTDRIDLEMKEGDTKLVEDPKKSTAVAGKKPVFKFDEEEDDDEWEALPPFLRRKK